MHQDIFLSELEKKVFFRKKKSFFEMFPQSRACEARVQTVIKIHKRNENFKNGRVLCRFTAARSTLKPHPTHSMFTF